MEFGELNSSNRECSLLDNEQTDALDEECIVKPDAGSISATRAEVAARFIVGWALGGKQVIGGSLPFPFTSSVLILYDTGWWGPTWWSTTEAQQGAISVVRDAVRPWLQYFFLIGGN
jgi:hypothetical protein